MQFLGGNSWKRKPGLRAGDGDSWQDEQRRILYSQAALQMVCCAVFWELVDFESLHFSFFFPMEG